MYEARGIRVGASFTPSPPLFFFGKAPAYLMRIKMGCTASFFALPPQFWDSILPRLSALIWKTYYRPKEINIVREGGSYLVFITLLRSTTTAISMLWQRPSMRSSCCPMRAGREVWMKRKPVGDRASSDYRFRSQTAKCCTMSRPCCVC